MNDTRVSPRDLRRQAPRKVEERMLDIWGMIDGNSGVIHSKMILTDRSLSNLSLASRKKSKHAFQSNDGLSGVKRYNRDVL